MDIFKRVRIDRQSGEFIYVQLFKELTKLIESGELKPYDKLPPIRNMSKELDLNSITIVNAYKLLESSGLVHKKVGSGTYISPRIADDESADYVEEGIINFTATTPPIDLFPVDDFKASINEVIDRDGGNAFGYHEGKGYRPLREIFKKQLADQGIGVNVDSIQIVSGVQQGIDIVSKALLGEGDHVIVEAPTYAGAIGSFRIRGASIVEVDFSGADGIDMDELERNVVRYRPKLMYTIPNFQNPSGMTYPEGSKKRLLELAAEYNFYIIEDDFATDLSFAREEPSLLKKFDMDDRVIYMKSFSKLFMPGLRIGFMIVPPSLEDLITFAKHTSDISTSGFMQRAFDGYLKSGRFDRQFKHVYRVLKERYQCAHDFIRSHRTDLLSCNLPDGGINFWFTLSPRVDSERFFSDVEAKGIRIVNGESFFCRKKETDHFRISVAGLDTKEIEFGLEAIFRSARDCQKRQVGGSRRADLVI